MRTPSTTATKLFHAGDRDSMEKEEAMASKMHWVSVLSMLAFGAFVLPAGCHAESGSQEGDGDAERVGEAEQAEVVCGCDGPDGGCSCLGLCCDLNNWRDLGNPGAGHCTEHVNHYCSNKGGNCGACWGRIY